MQIENPDMPQQNKITVAGDGNITIQDVNNSTIHLNANDPAILRQLEALQQSNTAAFQSLMEIINKRQEPVYQHLKNAVINSTIFGRDIHIGDNIYLPQQSKPPKDLSLNIPKVHPDDVVGREDDLKNLHDLLFENKRVVVVNGLGGLGKTTLAQTYIGQYYTEYRHVLWISQLSEDLINDTINAEGLTKQLHINTEGQDPQAIFLEIISRLKSIGDSPNLLVIDNAEASLARLYDLLPAQPDWHVLVTSREKIERFYIKELDFLSPEQALALFKRHCSRIEEAAAIQSILKTIDYHTLTIEILAKTAQKQRTPIAELQSAIQNDLQANIYIPHKGEKIDKVRAYLASIFDFSGLSSDEAWLLQQFLCLPSEYHAYASLEELIDPAASERSAIFSETLEELVAKGWLLHNTATDSYKMHRVIAEVASEKLPLSTEAVLPLIKRVTDKLYYDQTKDNPVDKFPWVAFGKSILEHFSEEMIYEIAHLQNEIALISKLQGDYKAAKAYYTKALAFFEKAFGENHSDTATLYSNLATVLQDLGDYEGAKALLEKALALDEQNFGAQHPTTAVSYSNLALVLKDLGDYEGAKALLEKALASDEHNFGAENPNTAVRYSNLATVLQALGDYAGAKGLLEKALASDEYNFGAQHPSTARTYSNLALVLQDLGDYEGAKALLEKALASAEQNFGTQHPNTAVTYSNLALVLQDLGDYAGAKALLEKALASDEHNFGAEHRNTARTYSNLATVLQALEDYEGAKALLEKALASDERNFGKDHTTTATRYSNLALVLQDLGDYDQAIGLLEKAYLVYKNHFGKAHPQTKIIKGNLEFVLEARQGQ